MDNTKVCIQLVKQTMRKCFQTNTDVCLTLLQIRLTPLGPRLPCPATLLFNRPARSLLLKLNRPPVLFDKDEIHYGALKK